MPTYVHNGSGWQEISGTDRPFVHAGGSFQGVNQIFVHNGAGWQQAYQYDNTGPVVPTPTVVQSTGGTFSTVSWGAITDAASGVASATLYQIFVGSVSGFVSGTTYSIPSGAFGGGSTNMSIGTNRRYQSGGETWQVTYYIIASDNAGNSTTGLGSIYANNKPYGNFTFQPVGAGSWTGGAWAHTTTVDEGMVGYSLTAPYPSGAWFYGSAIVNACLGFAADDGNIFVQRAGASQTFRGNSGTFTLQACDRQSASGAPTFVGSTLSTGTLSGNDATALVTIPADWRTAFANGTAYGAGLVLHSSPPGFLRGLTVSTNNNPFGIYSGTIGLVFN